MSALAPVTYLTTTQDLAWSRITDLDIISFGGVDVLVSITRFDGALQSWDISGPAISGGATLALDGGDVPGGSGAIVTLQTAADPVLLIGGGAQGTFQQVGLVSSQWQVIETLPIIAGFQSGFVFAQPGGAQVVYGGMAGASGIAALHFDATLGFSGQGPIIQTAGPVTAMTTAAGLVFTVDTLTNQLTGWQPDTTGALTQIAALTPDDGLWIAAPTAIKTATVDGLSYLVLAAAGSSSLTVIEVDALGNLIIRDHLLDTLQTRFGGVTALDIVDEGGRTYVIAGGADDGLSVFTLLPGGQLVGLAHIADTTSIGLDNVSAIAARGRQGGLDIYAASSSEPGITQLRLETGLAGATQTAPPTGGVLAGSSGNDILLGGAGDDIITGGAGNDILRDGAGVDVLTGGAGANLFIMAADGALDIITDFKPGIDSLDLSLWPMLRDISQLTMTITDTGFRIRYGDEDLIVNSADGAPIDYRILTNADLLGGMRLPVSLTPGIAGPATPAPSLTPPSEAPAEPSGPYSYLSGYQALASGNLAEMRSAFLGQPPQQESVILARGHDSIAVGNGGENVLIASADGSVLVGNGGHDLLIGRDGRDVLIGGAGADILIGGAGDDDLRGGDGDDLLIGGEGNDRLHGGFGNDVLIGGPGADTFIFSAGHDQIKDYEQGIDRLILDARLWTGLTSAADVLFVYGSWQDNRAIIDFGTGDVLWIDGVTDYAAFVDDIALF